MSEQDRVKLVCPECGGPLPADAASRAVRCERCGVASAPVATNGRNAKSATNAAPCGTCPRCDVALFEGDAHGVRVLGCGRCGGIFLDNLGSTRITRAPDATIGELAERARRNATVRVDERPRDLPCPTCGTAMRRTRPRDVVEIDFCDAHGTWFDRGELNRVMSLYRNLDPTVDVASVRERAASELQMAAFRTSQRAAIASAETSSEIGAVAITAGLLGVLGALLGSSEA